MAHDTHHHHGGPDHVPHVSPLKVYYGTWGALMALTVVTVGASYLHLGHTANLALALLIAFVKATLVAVFFMHLAHDSKFHSIILISGVVFFIVFVAFTMFDTAARGRVDPLEKDRTSNIADPWAVPVPASAAASAAAAPSAAPAGGAAPAPGGAAPDGKGEAPAKP